MRDIRIEFTNERIIPSGGLAVVGAILGKSDFVKKLTQNVWQQELSSRPKLVRTGRIF